VVKTTAAPPPLKNAPAAGAQLKPPPFTPPGRASAAQSAPNSPPPIQLKPAGPGGVIQPAKRNKNAPPAKAKGPVSYYSKNGTRFATDGATHWYKNSAGTWTRTRTGKTPTYNRFTGQTMGRGGQRQASFKSRMGSAASYSDTKRQRRILRSTPPVEVKSMKRGKRTYRSKMRAATSTEGHITTTSATAYAAHFGAPVIAGGYNWCHLHGHGGGGSDDPSNIVAASTHCNSEQLEIEKIVYQYRNSGVRMKVVAERYNDQSQYLARKITCTVYVGSKPVYVREMNALRTDKPSFIELLAVKHNLTEAITSELNS
jgi:hypothetical protein